MNKVSDLIHSLCVWMGRRIGGKWMEDWWMKKRDMGWPLPMVKLWPWNWLTPLSTFDFVSVQLPVVKFTLVRSSLTFSFSHLITWVFLGQKHILVQDIHDLFAVKALNKKKENNNITNYVGTFVVKMWTSPVPIIFWSTEKHWSFNDEYAIFSPTPKNVSFS